MTNQPTPKLGTGNLLSEKREGILELAARNKARNVRVFGSAARGEATPESDIDFLVDFEAGATLVEQARLIRELEALLGCRVDVVSEKYLKRAFRPEVMRDAVKL